MKKLLLLCIVLFSSANTFATTLKYTGVVTYASAPNAPSSIYDQIDAGDIIEGLFSYNPFGVTDASPNSDMVGSYNFNESNSRFQFSVFDSSNNNAILYQESGRLAYILTENNWQYTPNPSIYPTIDAFTPVGLLDDSALVYLRYQNRDNNLDLITTDELPLSPLAFNNYNYHEGRLSLPHGYLGEVDFNLTSLTPVPAPSTGSLMIIALALLLVIISTRKMPIVNHRNQLA